MKYITISYWDENKEHHSIKLNTDKLFIDFDRQNYIIKTDTKNHITRINPKIIDEDDNVVLEKPHHWVHADDRERLNTYDEVSHKQYGGRGYVHSFVGKFDDVEYWNITWYEYSSFPDDYEFDTASPETILNIL